MKIYSVLFISANFFCGSSYRIKCSRKYVNALICGQSQGGIEGFSEKFSLPTDSICDAIDRAPEKRLSVSDAAMLAGCDLTSARKGLITLAYLTAARLDVTKNGDIIYSFPQNYRNEITRRSLAQRIKRSLLPLLPPFLYMTRVTFGAFLVISLAIIGTTFMFISVSGGGQSSENSDRDDRPRSQTYVSFPSRLTFDLFGEVLLRSNSPTPNFFESCFRYVFGEGNPNQGVQLVFTDHYQIEESY